MNPMKGSEHNKPAGARRRAVLLIIQEDHCYVKGNP